MKRPKGKMLAHAHLVKYLYVFLHPIFLYPTLREKERKSKKVKENDYQLRVRLFQLLLFF